MCDAREVAANRARFRRAALPVLEYVNHVYCPAGRWPTRAWVLVPRQEYAQLNTYATTFQLVLDALDPLKHLSIVQAQCVTRGLAADAAAMYLIELTDGRGIAHNRWFRAPVAALYNLRAPAYPQTFYPGSMNGGTTWTWTTMLQDLWGQVNTLTSSALGTWPGLPYVPAGTPEGFQFIGTSAWSALNDVLDHLGMQVACNLMQTDPFTIVSAGAADGTLVSLQAKYVTNLEDDLEWIDTGAGRVPRLVRVFFRRRNSVYGTEETVRYDSPYQWNTSPYYGPIDVTAPATFAAATGTHHLWSDFTVRYDVDGNPLAADVLAATTIAQERAAQYFAHMYRQTAGYLSQTYAGALPFTTGSLVDGVCWKYGERNIGGYGWGTQIVRGAVPPWPELWENGSS